MTASGGAGAASLGAATNPFRNSWFTINANASTKTFGVGRDYIGTEDEVVSTDYAFTPRYSFLNSKKDWAWVGLNINWAVEHTNSDSTTYKNQTLFGDLGVQSAYNHTFLRSKGGLFFLGGPRAAVTLPTSLASQGQGIYARTNLGLGALGNVPFHEGDWFNGVFLATGATWQHTFSNSNVPYNEELLNRPRQGLSYQPVGAQLMDQSHMLNGRFLTHDQLAMNLNGWFGIYGDLALGLGMGLQLPWRYEPTGAECLQLQTGCVDVKSGVNNAQPQSNIPVTVFDASLNYTLMGVTWLTAGYNNSNRQLGEDGTRENYFYSPSSQFYVSAILMLDTMYNKYKASQKAKQSASSPVAAALGF